MSASPAPGLQAQATTAGGLSSFLFCFKRSSGDRRSGPQTFKVSILATEAYLPSPSPELLNGRK